MIVLFELVTGLLLRAAVANIWRFVKTVTQKGIIVFAAFSERDFDSGFPAVMSTVVRPHEYGVLAGVKTFAIIAAASSVIATMPRGAMQTDLLGDGGRIFPEGCGNASKGTIL